MDDLIRQGEAVDAKAIDQKRRKASDANRNRQNVLRELLLTTPGRQFLWDLLAKCKVYSQTFAPGPEGHALMAFEEGKRSIGLELMMECIRLNPKAWLQATIENTNSPELVNEEVNND